MTNTNEMTPLMKLQDKRDRGLIAKKKLEVMFDKYRDNSLITRQVLDSLKRLMPLLEKIEDKLETLDEPKFIVVRGVTVWL